jgi:hypothetical protein
MRIAALVLGILQILSLSMPSTIWQGFSGWFRTVLSSGYPSEQIVRPADPKANRSSFLLFP